MKINIRLGPQQFAAEREGLVMLGTVQRGLEIGALARTESGDYLQVNGDILQPLNKSRIETALRKMQPPAPKRRPVTGPTTTPVVTIKRRRIIPAVRP